MKMKRSLMTVVMIGIIGLFNLCFAAGSATTDPAKQLPEKTEAKAGHVEVKGVIKQTDSGLQLFDGRQTYLLKGKKPLKALVGKLVKVSGDLKKTQAGDVIHVEKATATN